MKLWAGTSGFSYDGWKGVFYPEDLPSNGRLRFYAEQLPAVEINNTFYRMPRAERMERWAGEVPETFRFVIKSPRRITHSAKLGEVDESLGFFWKGIEPLGERRGPVLFQCPPTFKKDVERLRSFLGKVPPEQRPVLEFRNDSWKDEEVHALLRERNAALCTTDDQKGDDDGEAAEIVPTADWGYLRLRGETYGEDELRRWAERIAAQPWEEAWVFLKHEDAGTAPGLARRLIELFEEVRGAG